MRAIVFVSCAVACGGARVAPAPATIVAPAHESPADAAVADAADACVERSTIDGPKLGGDVVAIEICTTSENEIHGGMGKAYERSAKLVARPSGVELDLGAYREEHDEYGGAWSWSFHGALGNAVIVERAAGADISLLAFVLHGGAWSNAIEIVAHAEGVGVTPIDAARATVTTCAHHAQTMTGMPDGPCEPERSMSVRWTGTTIEVGVGP